jgi:tagatose 1,6-diphosphate aldolase GatY/KbaY
LYSDPDVAKDFVEKTGIASLAPAFVNAYGFYTRKPRLDFKRLRTIREKVQIPLVLHHLRRMLPAKTLRHDGKAS